MLKEQNQNYKKILENKDHQINSLTQMIGSYKDFSNEIKSKWWQSPIVDILLFMGGMVFGVVLISVASGI